MSVCRVCIHTDRSGDPVTVDVALPSGARVGELLPAIVELIDDRASPGNTPNHWRLDYPTGPSLEESLSLTDNGVRDGDLLILSPAHGARLGPVRWEPCQAVIASRPTRLPTYEFLSGGVGVLATALAAAALAGAAGSDGATVNAILSAVGMAAAAAMTMATGYATASCLAVVFLACATGFLAVPSGPAAPNVFLAATATLSTSLLLLRLSGHTSPVLIATATLSLLAAVVTLVAMPVATVGAVLSTGAVALLAIAPRLSVLAAGLGPTHWTADLPDRAAAGHANLTGLVAGCAAGTAAGTVVVAGTSSAPGAIALTAVAGTVLLLRARTHADQARQLPLIAGGLVCLVAGLYIAIDAHEQVAGPVAGVLVAIGLTAARRPRCSAAVSRFVDRLEYVALAALVPVACWVAGGWAIVGGFHLR